MESTTPTVTTAKPLEMGCIEDREVITTDGRNIGTLTGAWIDLGNWSVTALIVELNKTVVDELNVKKPVLRTAKVNIPTAYVKNIGDVVQLNTDVPTLGAAFSTSQG
jgi:sporulation protein YlmC with PRC-barrel domain